MVALDEQKVEKLVDTIMDFLYGTKLTNGEIDYVINTIWSRVMTDRITFMILSKIPVVLADPEDDYPKTGGPGIH